MNLSKALSGFSFVAALAIGILVGYVANGASSVVSVDTPCASSSAPLPIFEPAPVTAESLRGIWKGTWGYNRAACTIEIRQIDGEKFYGTLRKGHAVINFEGEVDANSRTISFRETEVIKHGEYRPWSLGTNTGTFSLDGRSLTGAGSDKYGMYSWDAEKE